MSGSETSPAAGASAGTAGGALPIVANPVSGQSRGRKVAEGVRDALRGLGVAAEIHWTEDSDQAQRIAAEVTGDGAGTIVACGGDGTIHNVVNAVAGSGVVVGVAPAGRGNDLARMLDLPREPGAIAAMLAAGRRRRVDLGRATEDGGRVRHFVTVAACGFDAEVARRLVHGGPVGGPWAYMYGTAVTLMSYQPRQGRIEGDFGVFEGPFFLAATANTSMYGGGISIAPGAAIDDGLFRLCIIRPISRPVVVALFRRVRAGTHLDHPAVSYHTSRKVRIATEVPIDLFADGEPLATTPVTLEVLPGGLEVIVP